MSLAARIARLPRNALIVLGISVALHVGAAGVAGAWIVARYFSPPPAEFKVTKDIRLPAQEREHRMNMDAFDAMTPKPSFSDKMSSMRPTSFALPELPKAPMDQMLPLDPAEMVSDQIGGLAGTAGAGAGGYGSGGLGGTGSGVSFFGISDRSNRIVVVIDVSDTMFDRQPGRFGVVQAEATRLVEGLGINAVFNVIIYEGGSVAIFPQLQPATDASKLKAKEWIRSVQGGKASGRSYKSGYSKMGTGLYEGGGTRPDTALKQALAMRPTVIFLLTDGEMSRQPTTSAAFGFTEAEISEQALLDFVKAGQEGLAEQARIHTIHFLTTAAKPDEEKKLRSLARRNGGQFRQIGGD